MKTKIYSIFAILTISLTAWSQGVGVSETGANPDASAILDASSTTKGFLPPRMTTAQRNAISSPAAGLVIYNTTVNCLQWFDATWWYNACDGSLSPTPNINLTVVSPSYQGVSVINSQGVGYNGEVVPVNSTITVQLTNTSGVIQNFGLMATDPATNLQYSAAGVIAANTTIPVILSPGNQIIPWDFYGTITMALQGASNSLILSPRIDVKSIPASQTQVIPMVYGTQTWMDRNLGARRPAQAINDVLSYGNQYQWGRPSDGHEITVWNGNDITSGRGFHDGTALEALATSDTPGHPNFILTNITPFDWRNDNNNNRWATANQGPCPTGYHVPSRAEWVTADEAPFGSGNGTNGGVTTGWDNSTETYESALKIPQAGFRSRTDNMVVLSGAFGLYWSTTISTGFGNTRSFNLGVTETTANVDNVTHRASGLPVRCIID